MELDCGESALCLRLFTCVASALVPLGAQPRPTTVVARGSLNHRSLGGVEAALNELDVRPETRGGRPPVEIRGPLRAGSVTLDASDSSQGLSGLLVALPLLAGDSRLEVTELRSRSYARLTLDVLALAGVNCRTNTELTRVEVAGGQHYQPFNTTVEGDWSGAAFPLVAGAWAGPVTVAGLNPGSMQPDRAVVEALEAAGAQVSTVGGTVTVRAGRARAFSFDATDCPDLLPPLAALAASCPGTSELKGAQRLRRKESDRAEALRLELGKLGVPVVIRGDVLEVTGVPIRAGRVQAHGDHRIAMTLAIAALRADAPCELEGAQTVAKSYPEFFRHLEVLRGGAA